VGARAPGRRPWRCINTLYSDIEKTSFSAENWAKIFLKMLIFLEKSYKIAAASGDPPSKIPAGLQRLGTLSSDLRIVTLTY